MRAALLAVLIVVVAAATAQAAQVWLWSNNGHAYGNSGGGCTGALDLSQGCPMPMLGGG
jgi:hypothetical protein